MNERIELNSSLAVQTVIMKWTLTTLFLLGISFGYAQGTRYFGLTPNDHTLLVDPKIYDGHGVIPTCDCIQKKGDLLYWKDPSKPYVGSCIVFAGNYEDTVLYFSRKKTHFNHVARNTLKFLFMDQDFFFKRVVDGDTVMVPCDSTEIAIYSNYRDGRRAGDRAYYQKGVCTKWEYYDKGELVFYKKDYGMLEDQNAPNVSEVMESEVAEKQNDSVMDISSILIAPYWMQTGNGKFVLPCCDCLIKKNGVWYEENSDIPYTGQCSVIRDWKIREPLSIDATWLGYHNYNSKYFPKGLAIFEIRDITSYQISLITPSLAGLGSQGYDALGHPTVTVAPNLEKDKLKLISSYLKGVRHGERIYYEKGKTSKIEVYNRGQLSSETVFTNANGRYNSVAY